MPDDTIIFSPDIFNSPRSIVFSSGQITISKSITLDGTQGNIITPTLSGNYNQRIFHVLAGVSVKMNQLTFAYGRSDTPIDGNDPARGGAIWNEGNTSINNSIFLSNTARTSNGGAIYNTGTINITSNRFVNNRSAVRGVAIDNRGLAILSNTVIYVRNVTDIDGSSLWYGSIFNEDGGVLKLSSSQIIGDKIQNTTSAAIVNEGDMTIHNSTLRDIYSGAVYNKFSGVLTVTGSAIVSNRANSAAGILNQAGRLYVSNSIFAGNYARTDNISPVIEHDGGAIYSNGLLIVSDSIFIGNCARYGLGGGLYSEGILSLERSTFIDNTAPSGIGGGVASTYIGNITNTTFYSNSASYGGGVYATGDLRMVNSSIVSNRADGARTYIADCGEPEHPLSDEHPNGGGGISAYYATLTNTLLAANVKGGNCSKDSKTTSVIVDGGHNLDEANSCGFSSTTSLTNTNPLLEPALYLYQLNTPTSQAGVIFPLQPNSPAIDAGDDVICPATDQRGMRRPMGAHCDIGAYETVDLHTLVYLPYIMR